MPLPRWVEPQLSKLVEKAPTGSRWVHEIKFDGFRMAARIDTGKVQLLTRSGLDWTAKYPATAAAFAQLPVKTAYIDGELCGVRADGVTSAKARRCSWLIFPPQQGGPQTLDRPGAQPDPHLWDQRGWHSLPMSASSNYLRRVSNRAGCRSFHLEAGI
jgi:hypothetical protein